MKKILRPCEICETVVWKSVISTAHICSDKCKAIRKETMPKRISITSVQYWVNKGQTLEHAKETVSILQRQRSKRCVEYYTSRGLSIEEALSRVNEYQKGVADSKMTSCTPEDRKKWSPTSVSYWIHKGYSEDDAKIKISELQCRASKDAFILRYGEEVGTVKYEGMCNDRKVNYTLAGYVAKHGEDAGHEIWSRKFNKRSNSVAATNFFEKLSILIPNEVKVYKALPGTGEYGINDLENNKYYLYDFVIPEYKMCVEYHGDYWHCNPKKYSEDYYHIQQKINASDIWKKDAEKQHALMKLRGFQTIVVWESDNEEQSINNIMEKINEFNKS